MQERGSREAKLGLLIRWGLHSLTGQDEDLMYRERIPVDEYEKRAAQFTAERFSPREWARLAKEAGMEYMLITAKGRDGFSLFRTQTGSFNSCEAARSGQDVVGELAAACREEGLPMGVRYAHACDWRHPMAQSIQAQEDGQLVNRGNFWDYPMEHRKNLQVYLQEQAHPQLKELLTGYGALYAVRFDQPCLIRDDQAGQIRRLVHEAQPDCRICGRLCADEEDDCEEVGGLSLCWEQIMRGLFDAVSRGRGLLVGAYPQGDGGFSPGDRRALLRVGAWLKDNGEAVYGAEGSPFWYEPSWGRVTRKGNCLYLIVTDPAARSICLTGLISRVRTCSAPAGGNRLDYEETHDDPAQTHRLRVHLTGLQGSFRVVRVEVWEAVRLVDRLGADGEGRITLPVSRADGQGTRLRWTFYVDCPGRYLLSVEGRPGATGEIDVELDGSVHVPGGGDAALRTVGEVALQPGRHVLEVRTQQAQRLNGCVLQPV